jgi:hypothetical protein
MACVVGKDIKKDAKFIFLECPEGKLQMKKSLNFLSEVGIYSEF